MCRQIIQPFKLFPNVRALVLGVPAGIIAMAMHPKFALRKGRHERRKVGKRVFSN